MNYQIWTQILLSCILHSWQLFNAMLDAVMGVTVHILYHPQKQIWSISCSKLGEQCGQEHLAISLLCQKYQLLSLCNTMKQEQAESGFTWPHISTSTCFLITGGAVGAYRLFSLQMCWLIKIELKWAIFQQGQLKRLSPHQLSSRKLGRNSISGRYFTLPSRPKRMDMGQSKITQSLAY